jgi:hypothetical protein
MTKFVPGRHAERKRLGAVDAGVAEIIYARVVIVVCAEIGDSAKRVRQGVRAAEAQLRGDANFVRGLIGKDVREIRHGPSWCRKCSLPGSASAGSIWMDLR